MKIKRQKIPYRLLIRLAKTKNAFSIVVDNDYQPFKDVPIIFAVNHTNCYDFPITATAVRQHVYVLVGKQRLGILDRFFFSLNGTIYTDRLDKKDTISAKDAIVRFLNKGHSICWYPEGTWNLTDNLLMLPMKWGIIDVARQANAQIIPVALVYDRKSMVCTIRFGRPIAGEELVDKDEAIDNLRDTMATLRWDLISKSPTLDTSTIDRKQLKKNIWQAVDEYPPIDWEYEQQCVYQPYEKVETLPSTLQPRFENAFLFSKSWHG